MNTSQTCITVSPLYFHAGQIKRQRVPRHSESSIFLLPEVVTTPWTMHSLQFCRPTATYSAYHSIPRSLLPSYFDVSSSLTDQLYPCTAKPFKFTKQQLFRVLWVVEVNTQMLYCLYFYGICCTMVYHGLPYTPNLHGFFSEMSG